MFVHCGARSPHLAGEGPAASAGFDHRVSGDDAAEGTRVQRRGAARSGGLLAVAVLGQVPRTWASPAGEGAPFPPPPPTNLPRFSFVGVARVDGRRHGRASEMLLYLCYGDVRHLRSAAIIVSETIRYADTVEQIIVLVFIGNGAHATALAHDRQIS
jgi:hypothetical protein